MISLPVQGPLPPPVFVSLPLPVPVIRPADLALPEDNNIFQFQSKQNSNGTLKANKLLLKIGQIYLILCDTRKDGSLFVLGMAAELIYSTYLWPGISGTQMGDLSLHRWTLYQVSFAGSASLFFFANWYFSDLDIYLPQRLGMRMAAWLKRDTLGFLVPYWSSPSQWNLPSPGSCRETRRGWCGRFRIVSSRIYSLLPSLFLW